MLLLKSIAQFIKVFMVIDRFPEIFQSRPADTLLALLFHHGPAGDAVFFILPVEHVNHFFDLLF